MKSKPVLIAALILLGVVMLAGLTWTNYRFALASPGGTDFLVHWVGARTLFRGATPYSDQVAVEIQTMIYGRPARVGEHEFRVAYPLYSAIIFGPFALVSDFILARSLWMTFLEIVLLATSLLALKIVAWQPQRSLFLFIFFTLFWYHGVRPVINGNAVAVVALLFVAVAWGLQTKQDILAGFILALATIKPHLAFLPALCALIWMLSQRRWRFVVSFVTSLALITLIGMLIIPTWPLQNLAEILRYTSYNPPTTVGSALATWFPALGRPLGWLVSLLMAATLLWAWKSVWRAGFERFLWFFSLTLVASQWLGITTDPGNFIVLILPLVLVLKFLHQQPAGGLYVGLLLAILLFGLWALFLLTLPPGSNQQNPIMFFPLPLVLLIGLYAARKDWLIAETQPGAER